MADQELRELDREALTGGLSKRQAARRIRSGSMRECKRCEWIVPVESWVQHEYEHGYDDAIGGDGGAADSTLIPGRPRRAPLWCRVVIEPGYGIAEFLGARSYLFNESNRPGPSCFLPAETEFHFYGVSLIPDSAADPVEVNRIRDHGVLRFLVGGQIGSSSSLFAGDFPVRTLVAPSRDWIGEEVLADPENALAARYPLADVRISRRPVVLIPLLSFRFDLCLGQPLTKPTGIMLVCHGVWVYGVTA